MTALKDLLGSERGLIGLLLIICCTVLAAMNRMTFDDWQSYTMWIFGIYVGGKTITGAVQIAKGKSGDLDLNATDAEIESAKSKMNEMMKKLYGIDFDQQMRESKEASAKHDERMRQLDAEIEAAKNPPIAPPAV